MAKILISGYYGFDNAGDDSVLYGIISSLQKKDKNLQLGVLSNTPDKTEKMFKVSSYNRWRLPEVIKRIKEYDLLLMGGGSLLQDATSPRSVLYYLGIVMVAKFFKKPVIFYAQGIGPINKSFSKRLIKYVVNKVDIITVRDHQSGEDLKDICEVKVPIIVTADPAVTINPQSIDLSVGKTILKNTKTSDNKTMVICVRSWKNEKHYKKVLAKVADHYADKGWDIVFLPMQYPADITPSKDIQAQMKNKSYIINQQLHFKEIMSIIGNVQFILGMRLHSVILAAVMNVPFIAISYDPKIERFVERLDMFSGGNIQELETDKIIEMIQQIQNNEESIKENLKEKMNSIVKVSEESSQLTIDLLQKSKS